MTGRKIVAQDQEKVVIRETFTPDPEGPFILWDGPDTTISREVWEDPDSPESPPKGKRETA